MNRAITIVGASARAAAFSAVRAGFSVRAADIFGDADLQQAAESIRVNAYPAGLAAAFDGDRTDPWMYTGALENYPELVARWQRQRPLWGNPAYVLTQVRDPLAVSTALATAGLPAPRVVLNPQGLPNNGSWLCKSLRSAGGMRIAAWDADRAARPWRGSYFQQFVAGEPCAAAYVAAGGEATLLGVTRQLIGEAWTGATGFSYCGSWGPWPCDSQITEEFRKIGSLLGRCFGLTGLVGVDAIVNEQGVWVVEVNPRYTASIEVLERACGFQAIELHARACVEGCLPTVIPAASDALCGKAILFASQSVCIPVDSNFEWLRVSPQPWPTWADIPLPRTRVESEMPLVTTFASAIDEQSLLRLLRVQAAQVHSESGNPPFVPDCD